jgi:hypothetical protein
MEHMNPPTHERMNNKEIKKIMMILNGTQHYSFCSLSIFFFLKYHRLVQQSCSTVNKNIGLIIRKGPHIRKG